MRISSRAMCETVKRSLTGFSAAGLVAIFLMALPGIATAMPLNGAATTTPSALKATNQQATNQQDPPDPTIAGLWHVELVKQDGSLYYQSLQQYHPDGLEMEDAATPPTHPAHICMGVWEQNGNTISIYHIIWTYNGDGPPTGYVVLTENSTLGQDGNTLNGTYDMKQYDISDGTLLGHMTGTTVGRRIDFDHPFTLFSTGAVGATEPSSTALGSGPPARPAC